jgi:hypothetical protein
VCATKTCFPIEQRQKLVRRLDKRRHFENKYLAGNDHVVDIFTYGKYLTVYFSEKYEIKLCDFVQFLNVMLMDCGIALRAFDRISKYEFTISLAQIFRRQI